MCELGVFPMFVGNDLLKVDKILGLTFLKARRDLEGFNTAFSSLLQLSFVLDGLVTTPVYSRRRSRFVNSAFSNNKILAQKSMFIQTNVCRNCTFQVNRKKNVTGRRRLTSNNRAAIFSALHAKNYTTNPFGYKLGESSENNKALLCFSGKETVQTFSSSI